MDQFNAPLVRLYPFVFDDFVDQLILTVAEPVDGFGLRGVIRTSLGEPDTA